MFDFRIETSGDFASASYPNGEVHVAVFVNRETSEIRMVSQIRPYDRALACELVVELNQIAEMAGNGPGHGNFCVRTFYATMPIEEVLSEIREDGFVPAARSDIPDPFVRTVIETVTGELLEDERGILGAAGLAHEIMEAFDAALAKASDCLRPHFQVIDPPVLQRDWTDNRGDHREIMVAHDFKIGESESAAALVMRRFLDGTLVDKRDITAPRTVEFCAATLEARFRSHGFVQSMNAHEGYGGELAALGSLINQRRQLLGDVREVGIRFGGEELVVDLIRDLREGMKHHRSYGR